MIAKRSYVAVDDGTCVLASEQAPICFEPVDDERDAQLLAGDTEFWIDKPQTDVVLRGRTWNHHSDPTWLASIQVGRFQAKRALACGERHCMIGATGRVLFSDPELCEYVEISYGNAYGGRDTRAEERYGHPVQALGPYLPAAQRESLIAAASPFFYPRNPFGRGYTCTDDNDSLEVLQLPRLEDPRDLLTPERLLVYDPWRWPLQPLPCSFDWMPHAAFPRLAWFGHTPDWDVEDLGKYLSAFPELRLGYAEPELFELDRPLREAFDRRALNGASLGQRFPYLDGDETIVLENLHPRLPRWTIRLPGERPTLAIDDRQGGLTSLKAQLYTVLIEPECSRVTLTWCGFDKALRPYLFHELARMPFVAKW